MIGASAGLRGWASTFGLRPGTTWRRSCGPSTTTNSHLGHLLRRWLCDTCKGKHMQKEQNLEFSSKRDECSRTVFARVGVQGMVTYRCLLLLGHRGCCSGRGSSTSATHLRLLLGASRRERRLSRSPGLAGSRTTGPTPSSASSSPCHLLTWSCLAIATRG